MPNFLRNISLVKTQREVEKTHMVDAEFARLLQQFYRSSQDVHTAEAGTGNDLARLRASKSHGKAKREIEQFFQTID